MTYTSNLYAYEASRAIGSMDVPFYAIIMAAMRQADSWNLAHLQNCWPEVWADLQARYDAPGGRLPSDPVVA